MFARRFLLTKFAFIDGSSKNFINTSIKSSRNLASILEVYKANVQHFDSVHHLFFLQKYLSFTHLPDTHLLSSVEHFSNNLATINDRTFCHVFYLAKAFNLGIDWESLKKQVTRRHPRFSVDNTNLILLALKKSDCDISEKKVISEQLIKNVNLGRVTKGEDLVNLFQNSNDLGYISVSLNKGILGKLSLMEDWGSLKNFNIIIKTILQHNLDQNIPSFHTPIIKLVANSTQLSNLVILFLSLSKFHNPPLDIINKTLAQIKSILSPLKSPLSSPPVSSQNQSSEPQLNNNTPSTKTLSNPLSQLKPIDICHILTVINKLSIHDSQLFEICQEVFWNNITIINEEDFIYFLNAHKVFCLKMIQKISIQNIDYNRRLNSLKEYHHQFYIKLFTFLRTRDTAGWVFVYQILKVANGIYFTKNQTKDLAIALVREKVKGQSIQEDQMEMFAELMSILMEYKRKPEMVEEIRAQSIIKN